MKPARLENLVQQYKETSCEAWDSIDAGDVKIPLRDVFVMLEAVVGSRSAEPNHHLVA